jgi:hypothetical protein
MVPVCRDDIIAILFLAFVFPSQQTNKWQVSPWARKWYACKKAVAHSDESTGAMQNPFGEKLN